MPWFIKTEIFKDKTSKLPIEKRKDFLSQHVKWVNELRKSGMQITSGYLVDENNLPGGGGMLIIKSESYFEAKNIILKDPMIINNLVEWNLQEWKNICEVDPSIFIEGETSSTF